MGEGIIIIHLKMMRIKILMNSVRRNLLLIDKTMMLNMRNFEISFV